MEGRRFGFDYLGYVGRKDPTVHKAIFSVDMERKSSTSASTETIRVPHFQIARPEISDNQAVERKLKQNSALQNKRAIPQITETRDDSVLTPNSLGKPEAERVAPSVKIFSRKARITDIERQIAELRRKRKEKEITKEEYLQRREPLVTAVKKLR